MFTRFERGSFLSLVTVACTLGLVMTTVAVVSAAPPAIPKAKGLPAPKGGSTAIPLPKPIVPDAFSTIALKVERAFEIRGAVQHFTKDEGYVRLSYRGGKPDAQHVARLSRFDGGRRSETWLVPLTRTTTPMAVLPDSLLAPFSALGGTYRVAIVDVRAGRQLTNEVEVVSAPVTAPTVTSWKAISPELWRHYDQRSAPSRDAVDIDVELKGLRFLPSHDVAVRWELAYVPADVVIVQGAKPASKTVLRGDVLAGQATAWSAGSVAFSVRLPTEIVPVVPPLGKEWSRIAWDKLLDHAELTLSVIAPSTGKVLAGPTKVAGWTRRPPEPPRPRDDFDGDGEADVRLGGTDCDDDDARRGTNRTEVCDVEDIDEDCDPSTIASTNGEGDADGDGFIAWRCCNWDSAVWQKCGTDCNDLNAQIHPHQVDVCNGIDDDCDGQIDEELLGCPTTDVPVTP